LKPLARPARKSSTVRNVKVPVSPLKLSLVKVRNSPPNLREWRPD
jgi:hypothetical protein